MDDNDETMRPKLKMQKLCGTSSSATAAKVKYCRNRATREWKKTDGKGDTIKYEGGQRNKAGRGGEPSNLPGHGWDGRWFGWH